MRPIMNKSPNDVAKNWFLRNIHHIFLVLTAALTYCFVYFIINNAEKTAYIFSCLLIFLILIIVVVSLIRRKKGHPTLFGIIETNIEHDKISIFDMGYTVLACIFLPKIVDLTMKFLHNLCAPKNIFESIGLLINFTIFPLFLGASLKCITLLLLNKEMVQYKKNLRRIPTFIIFRLIVIICSGALLAQTFDEKAMGHRETNPQIFSLNNSNVTLSISEGVSASTFKISVILNGKTTSETKNAETKKTNAYNLPYPNIMEYVFFAMIYAGYEASTPYIEDKLKKSTKRGSVLKGKRQRRQRRQRRRYKYT